MRIAAPTRRSTPVGIALLSPGLAAFVYGVSEAGNVGLGGTQAVVGMAVGAALVAAFVVHALRARHPLLDVRLFADRVFAASSAAMALFAATMFAVMLLFPLYEQAARGLSALDAGLLMAPQGLAAMVAMPVAGKLTDLRGPRTLVLIGVAATVLGTIAFTQVSADSSQALLAVSLVPRGIGMGFIMAPLMAAAYRTLSTDAVARATPTMNIVMRVGRRRRHRGVRRAAPAPARERCAGHGRRRTPSARPSGGTSAPRRSSRCPRSRSRATPPGRRRPRRQRPRPVPPSRRPPSLRGSPGAAPWSARSGRCRARRAAARAGPRRRPAPRPGCRARRGRA